MPIRQGLHLPQLSLRKKFEQHLRQIDHTGVFVADQQRAGTQRHAGLAERVKIHRGILQAGRDDRAAGTAGLGQLEGCAVLSSPGVDGDHFAQGDAHRHFDQTGDIDIAQDGVDLGAGAAGRAELAVPVRAVAQDGRHIGQGFNIVDQGGFAPQTIGGRVGRAGARFTAFAFDRFDQGGFFTADIGAGAGVDVDIEAEIRCRRCSCPGSPSLAPAGWPCRGAAVARAYSPRM